MAQFKQQMTPIQRAQYHQYLLDIGRYKSKEEMYKAIKMSQANFSSSLSLLKMPKDVVDLLQNKDIAFRDLIKLKSMKDQEKIRESATILQLLNDTIEIQAEKEIEDMFDRIIYLMKHYKKEINSKKVTKRLIEILSLIN